MKRGRLKKRTELYLAGLRLWELTGMTRVGQLIVAVERIRRGLEKERGLVLRRKMEQRP